MSELEFSKSWTIVSVEPDLLEAQRSLTTKNICLHWPAGSAEQPEHGPHTNDYQVAHGSELRGAKRRRTDIGRHAETKKKHEFHVHWEKMFLIFW